MLNTIGYASEESGVSIETIRYYEREGIIPAVGRGPNGRRYFTRDEVSRLKFIKRFRSLGFSIADVKNFQELAFAQGNNCQKAALVGQRNLSAVQNKIIELLEIERALKHLIDQCAQNPLKCPILSELSFPCKEDDTDRSRKY